MAELSMLSDRELRAKLLNYGIADIPVTKTTRELVIRRLKSAMEAANGSHEVSVENQNQPSSARRRSSVKPKTRQRTSILASTYQTDSKTDDSDGCDSEKAETYVKKTISKTETQKTKRKSMNGQSEPVVNTTSPSADHISDEELMSQLAKFNIPCPTLTFSTRPILIKKLNHAMAKSRRESKVFSPPPPKFSNQNNREASDQDCPDNSSSDNFLSAWEKRSLTPLLSFSQQHLLTMGNQSSMTLNDSFSSLNHSPSFTIPSNIVNRFVEEQEPYDTGSDSETDSANVKSSAKKNWSFSALFPHSLSTNLNSPRKQMEGLFHTLKKKLNILWQWQFISVILPVIAVAFFGFLAAFYIKASYSDQFDLKDLTLSNKATAAQEPAPNKMLERIVKFLEKEVTSRICNREEVVPFSSDLLIDKLKITRDDLEQVKNEVTRYPRLGITLEGDEWTIPPGRLPLWCSVKTYFWNILVSSFIIMIAFGVGAVVYYLVTAACRRREKEEQEVYSIVEMIIDLLARHHAASLANNRPQEAFLAVNHVRDVLIPVKEKMAKLKLWNKAVQFLEDNESRVRAEIQQIQGEDLKVWRWLPPSACSPGKMSKFEQSPEEAANGGSPSHQQRPKVWQGQAFSTDSSGVNSPPPYPLTQCLKVRNMFDAEVEVGDSWPVRIQDAILEKAEGGKILHLAVDRASREGCVYIKCSRPEEAGKVYRSLHGWWFDGNLVTVKYLRPERYHYRFPDSIHVSVPLLPSNDKRLSLPTKFWKSPLEHF